MRGGDWGKEILFSCPKDKVVSVLFIRIFLVNTQCVQQQKQQSSSVLEGTWSCFLCSCWRVVETVNLLSRFVAVVSTVSDKQEVGNGNSSSQYPNKVMSRKVNNTKKRANALYKAFGLSILFRKIIFLNISLAKVYQQFSK